MKGRKGGTRKDEFSDKTENREEIEERREKRECWEHRKGCSAGGEMGINEWERTDEDEDIGGGEWEETTQGKIGRKKSGKKLK